jgi:hypothetical protein
VIERNGFFVRVSGVWVRADLIATVTERVGAGQEDAETYVAVVLTIPYKTLSAPGTAEEFLAEVKIAHASYEQFVGLYRATGMRQP